MTFLFNASDEWKKLYPESAMGVLAIEGIKNTSESEALDEEKDALTQYLRAQYTSREAIKAIPELQAYADYYKRFGNNYHVFFQLESVAVKGKPIPRVNVLVEAMFMAELKHFLLTAGHDLDKVEGAVTLEAAQGDETYLTMAGKEKTLKARDMYVRDDVGILSSIIYGPDQRTQISMDTTRALFTVYGIDGIGADLLHAHLEGIFRWIQMFSPDADIALIEIIAA